MWHKLILQSTEQTLVPCKPQIRCDFTLCFFKFDFKLHVVYKNKTYDTVQIRSCLGLKYLVLSPPTQSLTVFLKVSSGFMLTVLNLCGLWLDSETRNVTVTHVVQTDLKCRWFSLATGRSTSMKQEVVSERLTVRSGLHWLWIWRRTSERSVVREPDQFQTEMLADVTSLKLRESEGERQPAGTNLWQPSMFKEWTPDLDLLRTSVPVSSNCFLRFGTLENKRGNQTSVVSGWGFRRSQRSNTLLEMFCGDVTFCFHTPVTPFVLFEILILFWFLSILAPTHSDDLDLECFLQRSLSFVSSKHINMFQVTFIKLLSEWRYSETAGELQASDWPAWSYLLLRLQFVFLNKYLSTCGLGVNCRAWWETPASPLI